MIDEHLKNEQVKQYHKLAAIGRFRPLHIGGALMLEALCENAEEVIIGIGSSNKYNLRNPFTATESEEMINAFLGPRYDNYSILHVPDFAHIQGNENGEAWKNYVTENLGKLDAFVSGNEYVANLLSSNYDIIHPANLIDPSKHIKMRGGMVRLAMAKGDENYLDMVPTEVANYLQKNGLVERFRKEFGLATLAMVISGVNYNGDESIDEEWKHTLEK